MKEIITSLTQEYTDRPLSGQVLNVASSTSLVNQTNSTYTIKLGIEWNEPKRVEINEYPDSIEMIYTQEGVDYSKTHFTVYPPFPPERHRRTFKIVYSCVDGKWNKSEPIYGKIIPATKEIYEFED